MSCEPWHKRARLCDKSCLLVFTGFLDRLNVPYTVDANRTLRALRPIVVLGIYINTSLRNRPTRDARVSLGNIMYEEKNMKVCNINGIQ